MEFVVAPPPPEGDVKEGDVLGFGFNTPPRAMRIPLVGGRVYN